MTPPNRYIRIVSHPLLRCNPFEEQVLELDRKGRQLLAELGDRTIPLLYRVHKRQEFPHSLMLCDFMANLILTLQAHPSLSLFPWQSLIENAGNQIAIPLPSGSLVEPDAMFGLTQAGTSAFFLVEADRRTETLKGVYRAKLQKYRELFVKGHYRAHFGMRRSHIYALNLVSSERRMRMMMREAHAAGLLSYFLFQAFPALGDTGKVPPPDPDFFLSPVLNTAGEPVDHLHTIRRQAA